MTVYLSTLLEEARNLISDTNPLKYRISDDTLTDFINQAIRDLSVKFPRSTEYTAAAKKDTRIYELETNFIGVISVEYPTGEDPPIFLIRRSYTHPLFYQQKGYYDFVKPDDADSANPPRLYISENPPGPGTITLKLLTEHAFLSDKTDECTVQDRHSHLIGLFVRWKSIQHLSSKEMLDHHELTTLTEVMELNATRAAQAYYTALAAAQSAEAASAVSPWSMDRFDGWY